MNYKKEKHIIMFTMAGYQLDALAIVNAFLSTH